MPFPAEHLSTLVVRTKPNLGTAEAAHGYLTARLLTPEGAPMRGWLEHGFGVTALGDLPGETQDALGEVLSEIAEALRAGNFGFPVSFDSSRIAAWGTGFVAGMGVADEFWRQWTDEFPDVGKALIPIHMTNNGDLREWPMDPDRVYAPEEIDEVTRLVAPDDHQNKDRTRTPMIRLTGRRRAVTF
jgi:hypothetical protein